MATNMEDLEQQAKALPLKEKARLIESLIQGLDELDETNLEQLWLKEAYRRIEKYKAGRLSAKTNFDTFNSVRKKLQELR